jgi:hypothetical protein
MRGLWVKWWHVVDAGSVLTAVLDGCHCEVCVSLRFLGKSWKCIMAILKKTSWSDRLSMRRFHETTIEMQDRPSLP